MADRMQKGHYVEIDIARGRKAKVIVTDIKHKFRAKKYPYEVKFKNPCNNDTYNSKRRSLEYGPGVRFISDSHEDSDQCILDYQDIADQRADQKQELLKENRDKLRKLNISVGDVVVYQYSNGRVEEVVSAVNYDTGKIGIERFSPSQKRQYLQDIESANMTREYLRMSYPSLNWGRRVDRSTRWLNAKHIISVVNQVPRTASELLREVRQIRANFSRGDFSRELFKDIHRELGRHRNINFGLPATSGYNGKDALMVPVQLLDPKYGTAGVKWPDEYDDDAWEELEERMIREVNSIRELKDFDYVLSTYDIENHRDIDAKIYIFGRK